MVSVKDLEIDYRDLTMLPSTSSIKSAAKKKLKKIDNDPRPIDVTERVMWLERRIEDFERSMALMSKNIEDHRRHMTESLTKMEEKNGGTHGNPRYAIKAMDFQCGKGEQTSTYDRGGNRSKAVCDQTC